MESSTVVVYLSLVYCFYIKFCNCQFSSDGHCFRNKSTQSNGKIVVVIEPFCCRNFESVHVAGTKKTCKKCEYGFTSNDSKCKPCSEGKYGGKCGNTCNCHISERCDHKKGCVPAKNGNQEYGSTTTINNLVKEGTESNSVIIFMISIAVIGIIVIIIWTVWRCRFKLLYFKKIQRRRKLTEGRNNVSNGLQTEAEVKMEETDRHTTYAV
ncbi:unnamed protein product [Mytilus edulis]|uniref:Uncharacterized protein n=1 Tax=Mytilus edulis TaxID=6550 RepID=A0A8S3URV8_MYTED|nr:unnamed protein product [Mytilus edulis]